MRRWAEEVKIMERRKRESDRLHRDGVGVLLTGRARELGGWRKHRPFDSCSPSKGCIACEIERGRKAAKVKRSRVEEKRIIAAEMNE